MRILFCCNTLHGFCNFRLDVVEHLIGKGDEAIIVYPHKDEDEETLKTLPLGCRAVKCQMSPNGTSLLEDVRYFSHLHRIMKREKPDIVFNYTIKPNIYGGIAAKLLGIPSIAVVPGLGYSFARRDFVGILLRRVYKASLCLSHAVFVLNSYDREKLIALGVEEKRITFLKGGEGVNLNHFAYKEGDFRAPRFLMVSRLLYDKGYREFVDAAKRIKDRYLDVRFEIAGTLNEQNPAGVPRKVVEADERSGSIRYLGYIKDIIIELADPNTVVVLPSYYHEGMNRSLMEACSCGRPVITTNLPGLKEMVAEGENGFLVTPRNVDSLCEKITTFMELPIESRVQLGRRSREIAEEQFDVEEVKKEYDIIISKILKTDV